MIQKDIRDLRTNLTKYIEKYNGEKIYISKYNKIIGEVKFYDNEERERARLDIARAILNDSDISIDIM